MVQLIVTFVTSIIQVLLFGQNARLRHKDK